jgi:hypothetical protein
MYLSNASLTRGQKSPMTRGKIETAFVRLNGLSFGKNSEDGVDAQEATRYGVLFSSVILAPLHRILH